MVALLLDGPRRPKPFVVRPAIAYTQFVCSKFLSVKAHMNALFTLGIGAPRRAPGWRPGLPYLLYCAALAGALAGPARAADVSVYGYLDLGLVKQGGAAARLDRGLNNWLGVRGAEELGGGAKATFNLQMRFNPDSGMQERSSTLFQGESTLGIQSAGLGHLRLGRALTPLWQEKWRYDPWYDSGFMGSLESYNGDFDSDGLPGADYHNYSRAGNSVFYTSPGMAGFSVNGMAEIERAPGAAVRARGLTLAYAGTAATALLAYEKNHRSDAIWYGAASWRIESLSLIGAYSRTDVDAGSPAPRQRRSALLAATYALGGATVRTGYGRLRDGGDGGHKASVGYNHALSKRSNLYADLYRERGAAGAHGVNGIALGLNHTF